MNNKLNKNINKTIYIGDIHGSDYFHDFIKKYNDGNTMFVSVGDIFDRGESSYIVYKTIKELHSDGLFDMVLGNHDLFFILAIGLSEEHNGFLLKRLSKKTLNDEKLYKKIKLLQNENMYMLLGSGGDKTLNSILEKYSGLYGAYISPLTKDEQNERLNEIASFLWDNFDIYKIDKFNNLIVHGGIPILPDGSIVNVLYNGHMTKGGIDLLQKINKGLKKLNPDIIDWLSSGENAEYVHYNILYDLENNKLLKDFNLIDSLRYKLETSQHMTATWFNNSLYYKDKIGESLKLELKQNNLKSLICGHWGNKLVEEMFNDINSDYWKVLLSQENSLFRLDRSFLRVDNQYGNFGVLILNKEGKVLDIFDYLISIKPEKV